MMRLFKVILALGIVGGGIGVAQAVSLSLTPSRITNDFAGTITLSITGLASGQLVRVEWLTDFNGNGQADAEDIMVQSWVVTDGQIPTIDEVRNTNVPADEDGAANGQIRSYLGARLPWANRNAGTYLVRISSLSGTEVYTGQPFTVVAGTYDQIVQGTVTSGGAPVPFTWIGAYDVAAGNDLRAGAFADADGHYAFGLPVGSYHLVPGQPGFVADTTNVIVVSNAAPGITLDLALTPADRTISGLVLDPATGEGIPGVRLDGDSSEGQITRAISDLQGRFLMPVSAGLWRIKLDRWNLAALGYVPVAAIATMDARAGDVAGIAIAIPRVTALIYGDVKNDINRVVGNIEVAGIEEGGPLAASGRTDVFGHYVVGVTAGRWLCRPAESDLALRGYLNRTTEITTGTNQAVPLNMVLLRITAHIAGQVIDDTGAVVANTRMHAVPDSGTAMAVAVDSTGQFAMGVNAGLWHLRLDAADAQSRGLIPPDLAVPVEGGVDQTNLVCVAMRATKQLVVRINDADGSALSNLTVTAAAPLVGTNYLLTGRTDPEGQAAFGVMAGDWLVTVSEDDLAARGFGRMPSQTASVSDADLELEFTAGLIADLQVQTTNLPDATVATEYAFRLLASGGQAPYHWQLATDSASLPAGLELLEEGLITGSPMGTGTVTFAVRVSDELPQTAEQSLTLSVRPLLQITNERLPAGMVGLVYQAQFLALGGPDPLTWTLAPTSPPLPAGMNLDPQGQLSGVPMSGGVYPIIIRVTDGSGRSDDRSFLLTLHSRPVLNSSLVATNGIMLLDLTADAGLTCTVQASSNLTNWIDLFTVDAPGGRFTVADTNPATVGQRFYRVRVPWP